MSFLEEFDAQVGNPIEQNLVFRKWLALNWREMFAELRDKRPVLITPFFTVVTKWPDVLDVISRNEIFTVMHNRRSMDPSVGPFMLARDGGNENWHEKSVMRSVLRRSDLPKIRKLAAESACRILEDAKAEGEIDLVSKVTKIIPVLVIQKFFGFDPGEENLLKWSLATQSDMFRNPGGADEDIHKANVKAGNEMRDWLRAEIKRRLESDEPLEENAFSRVIQLAKCDPESMPVERIVTNIAGLLVGALETMSEAVVNVTNLALNNETWKQALIDEIEKEDGNVDAIVWEILRHKPINTVVARYVATDTTVAKGEEWETEVKAGSMVLASTASAMFDPSLFDDPDQFKTDRNYSEYLHFGHGYHQCLGKHVGEQVIPELVKQIFSVPGIARIDGPEGEVDFKGGLYPAQFKVRFGSD